MPPVPDLLIALPAVASAPPRIRRDLRAWLGALDWPDGHAQDVELAIGEAVSDALEHASPVGAPGSLTVYGWVATDTVSGRRRVVVTVIDRGRAHRAEESGWRGRGFVVTAAGTVAVHVERSPGGTTVVLRSLLVRPRAADR